MQFGSEFVSFPLLNFHYSILLFSIKQKKSKNIIEMRKHFKPKPFFFLFYRSLSDTKQANILRKARYYIKQKKYDEAVSMQALCV